MAGYKCPFCNEYMVDSSDTHKKQGVSFYEYTYSKDSFDVELYKCPSCLQISAFICSGWGQFDGVLSNIRPSVNCIQYPPYIPDGIRADYEEACGIVNLSPKASATLSRRCLQGMIRDFWGIEKHKLASAIKELEGKVSPTQWKVIDGLRKLGNIGAHMESDIDLIIDIDPDEAEKLLKLIELLMREWYINRYEQEQLYSDIISIVGDKESQRESTSV